MTIGHLGAKAGLRAFHLREGLLSTLGTVRHRYDALDVRCVVGVADGWDDDIAILLPRHVAEGRRRGTEELE